MTPVDARGLPLRPVLTAGGVLLALSLLAWVEKVATLGLTLARYEWLLLFAPELGFVLVFESAWLALAWLLGPSRRRAWLTAFHAGHLVALVILLVSDVFRLYTGTRLNIDLVVYAATHYRMLQEILGLGIDRGFWMRCALVALAWLLTVSRSRNPGATFRPRAMPLVVATGLGLFGMKLPELVDGRMAGFATAEIPGFLHSAGWRSPDDPESAPPAGPVYQPPRVTHTDSRPKPNILLVILESTRRDVVAPYAQDPGLTPAMAAVAARGLVFDDVYATVSHTSKALVGILCGFYPRPPMQINEALENGVPLNCLPGLLADAGYRSAFMQTALGRFENRPGLIRNIGFQQAAFQETLRQQGFAEIGYLGMDEFAMLAPAVDWARRGGGEPWFLTLLTVATHHPYETPAREYLPELEDIDRYRKAIAHQDRFLGELLAALSQQPGLDNTVVVILGDHGEAFGEHLRLQHDAVPYEEVMRVPLVIAGPEAFVGPPRRIGGLRQQVDLLPTLLEIAGAEWEGLVPGRSLLTSPGHDWVTSACWYSNYCLALREGDLKFVYHYGQQSTQVFDLARDPGELDDIADDVDEEQILSAENRALGLRRAVAAYYAPFPPRQGDLWWRTPPPAATSGTPLPGAAP